MSVQSTSALPTYWLSFLVVKNFNFDHFFDEFRHFGIKSSRSNYVIIYPVVIAASWLTE